jgi:hypothetical protein
MKTSENETQGQPQVGSDAGLEHLMAEKSAIEKEILERLEHLFPECARCTYKTDNMKCERWATVTGSCLYYGYPYVLLKPDHALKKPWRRLRISARHVSVL